MASQFLNLFAGEAGLSKREVAVLEAADVRSAADVDSLVRNFPSIVEEGVRLNVLSNAANQRLGGNYSALAESVRAQRPRAALGANHPPGGRMPPGSRISLGAPPASPPPIATMTGAIDLRVLPWPVRNQGERGTCVAFGTTACVEHLASAMEGANPDYSEQFLYWAVKTHSNDPNKNRDGTWLEFTRDMLKSHGICHETLCRYSQSLANPVSGPTPSQPAIADAAGRKFVAATHQSNPPHAAATVLALLKQGRPVAVCLPVFRDPALPNGPLNWTTEAGWSYGRILNPPVRSIVDGGHCVCITGYIPDGTEPSGGYFVVRNSWGTRWGELAPSPGSSNAPEQGYGDISATYVDRYCWELMQL